MDDFMYDLLMIINWVIIIIIYECIGIVIMNYALMNHSLNIYIVLTNLFSESSL